MELTIDPLHGGVKNLYSGGGRNSRFSTRLIQPLDDGDAAPTLAICEQVADTSRSSLQGRLMASGRIVSAQDPNGKDLTWRGEYVLSRGSRVLEFHLQIIRHSLVAAPPWDAASSWSRLPAMRLAFAEVTPVIRTIVRDRIRRCSRRRFYSPLGYLVDEGLRMTLVATHGAATHRRVQDRFMDTLLVPSHDAVSHYTFRFGFDVTHPQSVAVQQWRQPIVVPISQATPGIATEDRSGRGWLLHVSLPAVTVQVVDASRLSDGQVGLQLRLIHDGNLGGEVKMRFCRQPTEAFVLPPLSRPLSPAKSTGVDIYVFRAASVSSDITVRDDSIRLAISPHQVLHLGVIFPASQTRAMP